MPTDPHCVETASAVIRRVSPEVVLCHYKPGALVNAATAQQNVEARMAFTEATPLAVVTVFPADATFEMSLFNKDQYLNSSVRQRTRALAFVTECDRMTAMINLYFAFHPTHLTKQMFRTERQAMNWLEHVMGSATA